MRYCTGLFIFVLLFLACETPPGEKFEPRMCIHCLLHNGIAPVRAKVNRSYKVNEPYNPIFLNASARVWSRNGAWQLFYVNEDLYQTQEAVFVNEGDTFYIAVTHPDFDTVTGRTVVPGGFEINFPRPGDTVSINDSMVWTRSQHCRGYYMAFHRIEFGDTFYIDLLVPNDSFAPNYDSTRVKVARMFFLYLVAPPPDSPPKPCTLHLWALDTNYFNWVAAGGLVAGGQSVPESTHLWGGLGVFGSAVERAVPVFVRSDTAYLPPRCKPR
ncbi:MAG: DUF4249 family protein [candidate division WOR-3 bacterium]|jgi:hypothetical protein|nr:DUF4249 family protein [candidate division WOR-3 bacterium]MCR4424364.1 DUF4249 family protein [candidate division WOR-3 bacterium]MDH7518182.1 DUF4249 family protein [bacterium]